MFYEKLESVLKEKHLTLNKLAKGCEIAQSQTSKWKKGYIPGSEILIKICKYLNVSADYLLDLRDEAPPPKLTSQEQNMINNFRLCDSSTKENIEILAKAGAEKTLSQERSLN